MKVLDLQEHSAHTHEEVVQVISGKGENLIFL